MRLQVAVAGLLLLTDAVVSTPIVRGVVGQPVTLSCTYSTKSGVTTMCWGRGACPSSKCSQEIISTDGYHATYWKDIRYKLKGKIQDGNVSLTIENAAMADNGLYCCRVEHRGWFNDMKLTMSLEIIPDGNGTVTQSSNGPWHTNQTWVLPARNSWTISTKVITIGVSIIVGVLLILLFVKIAKKYLCLRSKLLQLSMVFVNGPPIGALQNAAEMRARAEDNVYFVEDNPYVVD
ncbi:PREDICTED: hepatitis A virus cellular receptor 1 [Condylura cristata]|uniref:hepatitis A virus cellular receptor 1 n=1 Tax=Condylura cristata TaxID=143302 RepID=UPI00033450A3|nr:PREDICTED: hepatitis A virus cellular receptor 1 [Condylura cristata]